jgi:hypothetical protein
VEDKLAKVFTLLILSVFLLASQECSPEEDYADEKFKTITGRELALLKYLKKASKSSGEKKKAYLIKYFKAFPSDFETYFKINAKNCYQNTLYTVGDTYGHVFAHNPWGKFYPAQKVVRSEAEIPKGPGYKRRKMMREN